jgi:hypothetical protein
MTLLIGPGLLEVPANAHVLAEEHFAMVLEPVQHLENIYLVLGF